MAGRVLGSERLVRRVFVSLLLLGLAGHAATLAAQNPCDDLVYRIEAAPEEAGAQAVPWWDGKSSRRLGPAFVEASGIRSAKLRPSRPFPGRFDLELSHKRNVGKQFGAAGNAHPGRQFAIVVGGVIVKVYPLPAKGSDMYQGGTSAGAFPKDVADRLLSEAEAAIDGCKGK